MGLSPWRHDPLHSDAEGDAPILAARFGLGAPHFPAGTFCRAGRRSWHAIGFAYHREPRGRTPLRLATAETPWHSISTSAASSFAAAAVALAARSPSRSPPPA